MLEKMGINQEFERCIWCTIDFVLSRDIIEKVKFLECSRLFFLFPGVMFLQYMSDSTQGTDFFATQI